MKTLRGQLTAWFIGLVTFIGVVASIGIGLVSFNEESGFLDDQLRQIALSVGDTPSAAGESSHIIAGADPEDHIIVHILDNNLKTIRNSDPAIDIPIENITGFYDHVNVGVQWRTFTLIAESRVVQVSQQTELRTAAAFSSMLNTILPIALLIPLSWVFVGWVVKRLLKPLQDLAAALLARQTASNIVLSLNGIPEEVVPLVDAMNNLLVRQHELLEFRQRFISDAAHQLRTPLTALNLQMENLKAAMPGKSNAVFLTPMQQGLSRMSTLLSQLLKLARADEPHTVMNLGFVNLSEIVRASLADGHELAVAKAIDLGLTADVDVKVKGEPLDLIMLLGNLLDNAIRYTPNGGRVDVEILASDSGAQVNIRDTGPGIPGSAMVLVFNRFYRHNPTGSEGSGLGLSIVAALAARNGVEVKLKNRNDGRGLIANARFDLGCPEHSQSSLTNRSRIIRWRPMPHAKLKPVVNTRIQARNKEVILEAALDVFSASGFRGATVDQIAAKASMSKPNLLYYFRRKEDIYVALLEHTLTDWLEPLRKIDATGDPFQELGRYISVKMELSQSNPKASRLFANEILHGAPMIEKYLKGPLRQLVTEKATVIQAWINEGKLASVDPFHFIFAIWSVTQHYADFAVQVDAVLGRREDMKSAQKAVLEILLRGLRPV